MPTLTPKILVVADGSAESGLAALYAGRRAKATSSTVVLLAVVQPVGFHHWIGVGQEMAREGRETAELALTELTDQLRSEAGAIPERVVAEGELVAELRRLVDRDLAIRLLVIGAAMGPDPGPLVRAVAKSGGLFGARAVPVTILPASLGRADILAIS